MMCKEIRKPASGIFGKCYEVSNLGQVYRTARASVDNVHYQVTVHKLVASAFLGKRPKGEGGEPQGRGQSK
jgi:hypothetical protein